MITPKELNSKNFPTDSEIEENLSQLLDKMNRVRKLWAKPMIVTSGLRSMDDHKRIYLEKGIPEDEIPMKSKHLFGQACDVRDSDGSLYQWCADHESQLLQIGLWLEKDIKGWVHFQIVPYGSWTEGKTIFFAA